MAKSVEYSPYIFRLGLLLCLFVILFVLFAGDASKEGVGASISTNPDGIRMIHLSMTPYALIAFAMALVIYSYTLRRAVPTDGASLAPAGLFRRLISFYIDFAIAMILVGVPITALTLIINYLQTGMILWVVKRPYQEATDWPYMLPPILGGFGSLFIFGLPVSKKKQSLGGLITGVYIYSGKQLSLIQSALRTLLGFITLCAAVISVPLAWASDDRRMWHDSVFDTYPKKNL